MRDNVALRARHRIGRLPARLILILAALAVPGYGAQFQLGVLIQAGLAGAGAGAWEIGAGNSSGAPTVTNDATPYWQNGVDRRVEIEYQKASNTLAVRLYQDATNTSTFDSVSFNPTGGNLAAANATWTLPASSFFVTATNGTFIPSSITLSNISLTGLSGALNILQPIQQTTLSATRGFFGPTTTVTQTQDIVFRGDATGSWRLTGTLDLTGFFGALGASGNDLSFGFGGTAADTLVPEPSTLSLIGLGAILLGLFNRRKDSRL